MKTWAKTKVQGLLRHQSGKYYARLYLAGKEKWLCLDTTLLEVTKAKLKNEREALAKASKTGWVPHAGSIKVSVAIESFEANLALRINIKESTRKFSEAYSPTYLEDGIHFSVLTKCVKKSSVSPFEQGRGGCGWNA